MSKLSSLEKRPTMFGLAGLALKFVSEERKIRFILKRVLKEADKLFGVPHKLTEDEDNFFVDPILKKVTIHLHVPGIYIVGMPVCI